MGQARPCTLPGTPVACACGAVARAARRLDRRPAGRDAARGRTNASGRRSSPRSSPWCSWARIRGLQPGDRCGAYPRRAACHLRRERDCAAQRPNGRDAGTGRPGGCRRHLAGARPLARDYTVFFHVLAARMGDQRYGQHDTMPQGGQAADDEVAARARSSRTAMRPASPPTRRSAPVTSIGSAGIWAKPGSACRHGPGRQVCGAALTGRIRDNHRFRYAGGQAAGMAPRRPRAACSAWS